MSETTAEGLPVRKQGQEARQRADGLPCVVIELMEYEAGVLRLDCTAGEFEAEIPEALAVFANSRRLPVTRKPGFFRQNSGTRQMRKRASFSVSLPDAALEQETGAGELRLSFSLNGRLLPVRAFEYQARLTSALAGSWWRFGAYLAYWHRDSGTGELSALAVRRAGRAYGIRRELALLKEILTSRTGSKQMFALRCIYWLVYPVWSRKRIWLTFDKLYMGGDCGEYFYRYAADRCKREKRKLRVAYILQKDSPDVPRLRADGYQALLYRSLRQRLSYLYASMVFGTHSGVPSFCGLNKWEIRFLQDRLKAVNVCIQHGLSIQDLTADSNRLVNNNKRYYCASRYEMENLSRPSYDYPSGVLRLTGIPRFDGLKDRASRLILLAPTWRADAAAHSVMGRQRPYSSEFRHSAYYRIYQALLEDPRLEELAQKYGYRILYLVHPVFAAQKKDFRPGRLVEVAVPAEICYEKALTEASLLITDYSGVQFDFAYMRKPVLYYHPPELPPQYDEGGFSYEKQGFGEICSDRGQLLDCLDACMQNGCRQEPFYRKRQDDFFAFCDHDSCRRIFEDAAAYMEEICSGSDSI